MSQKILDNFRKNYPSANPESMAIEVLRNNTYCVLGTATLAGEPWVTPVRYRFDSHGNIYWTSARDTRHSMSVLNNPTVSAVVIDLRFIDSVSSAVYCTGIAREIPYDELPELILWRYPEKNRTIDDFDPGKQHRAVYQLQTSAMWCLAEPEIINDVVTDKRIEVKLQKFQELMEGSTI